MVTPAGGSTNDRHAHPTPARAAPVYDDGKNVNRETRNNLIVLALLLIVLTPGAVILFRKKMQPTLRPMHLPHAVQRQVAYLSPLDTPPGKQRVEPPYTAKWVESLVRERIGAREVVRPVGRDGLPLVSDAKSFQVVAIEPAKTSGQPDRAWVIVWNTQREPEAPWKLVAQERGLDVDVGSSAKLTVPRFVREELGETGVLRPPHEVLWQELQLSGLVDGERRLQRGTADQIVLVTSFTSLERTDN